MLRMDVMQKKRGKGYPHFAKKAVCLMGKPSASGGKQKPGVAQFLHAVAAAVDLQKYVMSPHFHFHSRESHDQDTTKPRHRQANPRVDSLIDFTRHILPVHTYIEVE